MIGMLSPRDVLVNVCRIICNILERFINFPLKLSITFILSLPWIRLHTLLELLKSNNVRERVLATITSCKVHGF